MTADSLIYHWIRYPDLDGEDREFLCLCPVGKSHDAGDDDADSDLTDRKPETKES